MARYWYKFNAGDPSLGTSYSLTSIDPAGYCFGGPTACAIYARASANPSRPLITTNLNAYLAVANGTQAAYPVATPYVFVKD